MFRLLTQNFFLTDRLRTALISEFKLLGLRTELCGVQELLVLSHTPGRDIEISLDDDDWPYENVEYLNRRMNALSREGRHRQRGSSTTQRADTPAPRYIFIDSNIIREAQSFSELVVKNALFKQNHVGFIETFHTFRSSSSPPPQEDGRTRRQSGSSTTTKADTPPPRYNFIGRTPFSNTLISRIRI